MALTVPGSLSCQLLRIECEGYETIQRGCLGELLTVWGQIDRVVQYEDRLPVDYSLPRVVLRGGNRYR